MTVAYCDIQDGWTGTGNIDDDPEFVDAAEGMPFDDDLHILGGGSSDESPCLNAGDESKRPDDLADLNENQNVQEPIPVDRDYVDRVLVGEIDMGAYELPYCVGDVNADGTVDIDDIFDLLGHWGDCPDPPADCPWDVDDSGSVDIDDLFILLWDWGCGDPNSTAVPESIADCIRLYASDPQDLAACIEAISLTGGE